MHVSLSGIQGRGLVTLLCARVVGRWDGTVLPLQRYKDRGVSENIEGACIASCRGCWKGKERERGDGRKWACGVRGSLTIKLKEQILEYFDWALLETGG
jgi:hypothetical protein